MTDTSRIKCAICGAEVHSIQLHIRNDHPDWSIEKYQIEHPGQPLLSPMAQAKIAEKKAAEAAVAPTPEVKPVTAALETSGIIKRAFHEVFGIDSKVAGAMNARGEPIPISVLGATEFPEMVPDIDGNYVYELDNLKNVMLALELNMPLYVWGHAGTGKTTLLEQIAARTTRPMLRVQHTVNTEESHVVGQWVARSGETHFELGPLALAMKHGWVYLADEYDFALPSVLAVYQPVLEGKSLVIKEADSANRIIRPHPNFRFMATGNTNGCGDETGLYQGTSIQNAANYDRFGMVLQVRYMKPDLEERILVNQAGIGLPDAKKIVDFANRVRESYDGNKISSTISPRTLINAAKLGFRRGSFRTGVGLSFTNKLSRVDREVVDGLAQRIFG